MRSIVLLNMGGPNNLEEVSLFLKNMFNDPNILPIKNSLLRKFVAYLITVSRTKEATSNYRQLGGSSPLNGFTQKLIEKVSKKVPDTFVVPVMRYTPPFAAEAISKMREKGIKEVFLIPLYPHYSTTTVKSSLEDFYQQAKKMGFDADIKHIENFYRNSLYNEAVIEKIAEALKGEDPKEFELIFSAHSLPQRIVEAGDPYRDQVEDHIKILTGKLKEKGMEFSSVDLAYQSKLGPVKWLEPSLEDRLKSSAGKKVLIYPISFILDNSETLFELHKEYAHIAKELSIADYRVGDCVNDSDIFVEALIDIYRGMQ